MSDEEKEGFITGNDIDSIIIDHILDRLGCNNAYDTVQKLLLNIEDTNSINTGINIDMLGICHICTKEEYCMKHLNERINDLFTNVVDADVEIHLFSCDGFVSKHDDACVCKDCGGSCTCDCSH